MSDDSPVGPFFADFSSDPRILSAVERLGFERPTPIQALTIPLLLQGRDVIGQAQTGTGKTAAYGLPLMVQVDPARPDTQALILAPTRELALQVAKALKDFAGSSRLRVVPIYGGQAYGAQLRGLRRGAHIVVGTPGRVMDHMRRGSLRLETLATVVLDEADEMLNMGFIEDIEWILAACPDERQTTLFSATMPPRIRAIAAKYMRDPEHVLIERRTSAAVTIRQRYWLVRGLNKLDALSRILEAEPLDAALIFVRTRSSTEALADQLAERRFKVSALHGDMPQSMREQTVGRLATGRIDLVVATDVAARGLDIERFSHVINYDMPGDAEAYVHRIGRTGRAGRDGQAISFVAPRERRLLRAIERMTRQTIEPMHLPGAKQLNARRIEAFEQDVLARLADGELEPFLGILRELCAEHDLDPVEVAAALARKAQQGVPLLLKDVVIPAPRPARPPRATPEPGMVRYRLAVGERDGVTPANIVGAIANTADISGRYIGRITINEDHSLVDLPEGMPLAVFKLLQKTIVCRVPLDLRLVSQPAKGERRRAFKPSKRVKPKQPGGKKRTGGKKRSKGKK